MDNPRTWLERNGFIFSAICIILSTAIFLPGREYFAKGQWALLYLPVIVLIASTSGVRPALLAALLAFVAWNFFFLPPYHTLSVSDPKDWLSLFVFLIVGIAMGVQTGRMRWRESEALAREREAKLLNRFSSHLVTDTTVTRMADMLVEAMVQSMHVSMATLLLPDESGNLNCFTIAPSGGQGCAPETLEFGAWVFENAKAIGLPPLTSAPGVEVTGWPISMRWEEILTGSARDDIFIPLQAATGMEGVLHIGERSGKSPFTIHDARLFVSIANQAAAFIERQRLQKMANQTEALREADQLKSAFVSSVSHELKTPLASITATVTSLLEGDIELSPESVHEELDALGGDLDRLNDSINSLLDLSRLEAGAWATNKDWYEPGEILGTVASRLSKRQQNRIVFTLPDDLPTIHVDFAQWARALQNVIENALSYSEQDQSVYVGASSENTEIKIWVEDRGPGITKEERENVFKKFYRGKSAAKVPSGTGLGLAIAKEIVRSHGGRIWVEDVQPHGARIVIALPKEKPGA